MVFSKLVLSLTAATALAASVAVRAESGPSSVVAATPIATPPVSLASDGWWRAFDDPMLDTIVETVLAQNLDLQAALARIAQARAAAGLSRANMLPSAALSASAQGISQSLESPIGAAGAALGQPRSFDLLQAAGEASWEIDLFGRLSRQRHAALSDLSAAANDAAAIRLSLAAEASAAYVELRSLQASLAIAEARAMNADHAVDLVRLRVEHGIDPARALNQATGVRDDARAAIPALHAAIAGQADRIDVLIRRTAGTARAELGIAPGETAFVPQTIDPGVDAVPSDLMRRRPDVVAAEQRMVAADDRVAVALKEYYPRISLQGLLGVVTLGVSTIFSGDSIQAAGGASLRWRLFDFGRVDAEVAMARGQHAETLAMYRGVMVQATADVETALTRLTEARLEVEIRQRQVDAMTAARDQIGAAYREGSVALLDVLQAEQDVLAASQQLTRARARAAQASVFAVRALGGGFGKEGEDHG